MYKLIKKDGAELGYTEKVNYIKIHTNGCFVSTTESNATGVAFESIPYNLLGHNEISGADTVIVVSVDAGALFKESQKNSANIDYISMMTGVEIPTEVIEEEVIENE